jgi:hypothetical protein
MLEWNDPAAVQSIHAWLEGGALLFFAALVVFDVASHFAQDKKKERWLERIGLVCFAVAVLMEVAAYPYGKQNDELSSKSIAAANERASKADSHAADANKKAGDASQAAGDAVEHAAQLEKEAARLTKAAEDERMARVQLAASISWRTPDRALIPQLAERLQRFRGQRFAIVTDSSDPERTVVLSWIVLLLGEAHWSAEPAPTASELTFEATNIVLWLSPAAPDRVLEAAQAVIPIMERAGLPAVFIQSQWGPQPNVHPPELIRVVIFKKGPRMRVTGNMVTFEGLPTQLLFGPGPPH